MHTAFDKAMKRLELFHGLRVPDGAYGILRIDGRSFSKTTQALRLEKPFSPDFDAWMGEITKILVENLGAIYGYHQSDEISLLFDRDFDLFDREAEKIVSVSAGLASSAFMRWLMETQPGWEALSNVPDLYPHFDSRLIVAPTTKQVAAYFRWRQIDATRNALNSWCHWTAVLEDEMTARAAGKLFENKPQSFKHEFLFKHGINFAERPGWEKNGTGAIWTTTKKLGFNPKTQQHVEVDRRAVTLDKELPHGESYGFYVHDRLFEAEKRKNP